MLSLRRAESFDAQGPDAQRASDYLRRLLDDHDPPTSVALRVHQAIPEHVGLGSGTQLALAVGKAFSALFELPVSVPALAARLDRGARSGIGIGAFEEGGFVVDGGRGAAGGHPPVISRMPFPELLARAAGVRSRRTRPVRRSRARRVPRAAGVPAAARGPPRAPGADAADARAGGGGLRQLQRRDRRDPARGRRLLRRGPGRTLHQPRGGARLLGWLEAKGIAGVGQTSWGPTGFAIVDSEVRAQALLREARERFASRSRARVRGRAGAQSRARLEVSERSAGPFLASPRRDPTTPASRRPIDSRAGGGSSHGKTPHPASVHPGRAGQPVRREHGLRRRLPGRRALHRACVWRDVATLTQDAIFSRGPKGVRRTGIFIGGRDLALALEMLDAAKRGDGAALRGVGVRRSERRVHHRRRGGGRRRAAA